MLSQIRIVPQLLPGHNQSNGSIWYTF